MPLFPVTRRRLQWHRGIITIAHVEMYEQLLSSCGLISTN